MAVYRLNNSGIWKKLIKIYRLNNSGIWKSLSGAFRLNDNGIWVRIFSFTSAPVIQNTVELSKSADYHNSTNRVTLTGKKYSFTGANSFTYAFYSSPTGSAPWTLINGPTTTTNPASGSSSNVTYQLADLDFTSGTMYFQFRYTGTNTTPNPDVSTISSSNIVSVTFLDIPLPPPGFPSINQSTITVASTASSGTWTGSPTQYIWKWQYGPSNNTLTYAATKSISSISLSGTTATATIFDHGFKNGDLVVFSGINDLFNQSATAISSVFTNFFSYIVSKPAHNFATNYAVNQYVTFNGQIFRSLVATPTPRAAWSSTTSYTTGQYVNSGGQLWQATGPSINQTPIVGGDFWQLIDIYPTSTTYWQSQNGSIASTGTAVGPNYYEGVSASPVSYTITSFPSTDYKTGTTLKGLTTRMNVVASNAGFTSAEYNSTSRIIYGFPSITLGTRTITSTTASIPYTSTDMDVYDIDVKIGPAYTTSVSGYPKTNQANSSPISITGLTGGTTYTAYVTPKNADTPRISGVQKTDTFTIALTPSASAIARIDGTVTPTQPSTITFQANTPSTGQVTSSWTNGTPITSVRFQGSGAGINTDYTDPASPFITSDISNFTTSGTYSVTVTNTNNALQVNVSWNQTNAQSYRIDYSSSVLGNDVVTGDSSAASVSVLIPWSTGAGTFTLTGLTVYSSTTQNGVSTFYSNPVAGAITPALKTSTRSGSTTLTVPTLATPTFGTVTRAVGGFSVPISNFATYPAGATFSVTSTLGTPSRSGSTITVTGLSAGQSSTVSVIVGAAGYTNSATGQVTGTAVSTPSAPQSLSRTLSGGFVKAFTWSAPVDNGGSAITGYQYSVNGTTYLATDTNTSHTYTYSIGGTTTFYVRAVNAAGNGTPAQIIINIPTVTTPTASNITSTAARVSWTSGSQSLYSLSGVGPNSPYTGTLAVFRDVIGLTAATVYFPVVTITSDRSDTVTSSAGNFSTTGGNVAPSGGTYTFNPVDPNTQLHTTVQLIITNVSGTPSTFTYSFQWAVSSTSSQGSTYTNITSSSSGNTSTVSLISAYGNRWLRVNTTVSNGVSPNLTSTQFVFVSNVV